MSQLAYKLHPSGTTSLIDLQFNPNSNATAVIGSGTDGGTANITIFDDSFFSLSKIYGVK